MVGYCFEQVMTLSRIRNSLHVDVDEDEKSKVLAILSGDRVTYRVLRFDCIKHSTNPHNSGKPQLHLQVEHASGIIYIQVEYKANRCCS